MQQRPGAVAGQEQEERHAHVRDEIEGQEEDELGDLADAEGGVDGGGGVVWREEAGCGVGLGVFIVVVGVVVVIVVVDGFEVARDKDEGVVAFAKENLLRDLIS